MFHAPGHRRPGVPIVAGMATMPSRKETAERALASILPQVDRLWLFLDRFEDVPQIFHHPKIEILRSADHGDLRANGKFLGLSLEEQDCIYLSVDDDILYPHDYVRRLHRHLARYRSQAVVGVHASILKPPIQTYRHSRRVLLRRRLQWLNLEVDVLGTDSVALDSRVLRFDVREWSHVNMVDLHFAILCRRRGLPLISIRRYRDWIKHLDQNQPDSIHRALQNDDSRQTVLARELLDIPRPRLARRRIDA